MEAAMDHGHLCPLAKATEVLGERWTFLVIRALLKGSARFNEVRREVPLMSPSLLSQRLQRLESEGIVTRQPADGGRCGYRLTGAGRELAPIVRDLSAWGERWVLGHVDRDSPDVSALMWAVRRRVDPAAFGGRRVVVQFEFDDQPEARRRWWLINEDGAVDLCPKDPGFEVDLYVVTDLQTMVDIWVGVLPLSGAIDAERLHLEGARSLRQALRGWLLLSPLAPQSIRSSNDPTPPSPLRRRPADCSS
jgi:DNA-binding HxlR family transcriptional regulator